MLGDEIGLEPLHQGLQVLQMTLVERVDAAERKADAVQTQGVVAADLFEVVQGRAALAEVVFTVGLDPADIGQGCKQLLVVGAAQADAGAYGNRPVGEAGVPACTDGLFGGALAGH